MEPPSGPYFDWEAMSAAGSDHPQSMTTTTLPTTGQGSVEQDAPPHSSHTDDSGFDSPLAHCLSPTSLRLLAPTLQLCVVADNDVNDDSNPLVPEEPPANEQTTSTVDPTHHDGKTDEDCQPDPEVSTSPADTTYDAQQEQLQAERLREEAEILRGDFPRNASLTE